MRALWGRRQPLSAPPRGPPPEDWADALAQGRSEQAWDLFLERYRRLVFAAIRHYARDYDDVMDVFARVCEALREDDLRRLRDYCAQPDHRARFSTWLVTVVRHLTVDWFRHRDGRRRLPALAERLPPLQRRIFEHVFIDRRTHLETYGLLRATETPDLSFHEYQRELRATYRAVAAGRRGQLLRDLGGPPPPEPDPELASAADVEDLRGVLQPVLATLSAEDRAAVELYVIEELPAEQVARIVGYPNAKTVYNRVARALAALRRHLEEAGVEREDVL